MKTPKTCKTCAHRELFNHCSLSGYSCSTERKHPTVCGKNFEGWKNRLSVIERIKRIFYKS